jgi:DNA-binding response OmpR family regulator
VSYDFCYADWYRRYSNICWSLAVNKYSVLVVDDDSSTSKLIKHNLEDENTRVIEAATGLDCIKILSETQVDLILLDIKLPDFSGWGILSLLRLTEPLRHIPIIIVSVEPLNTTLMERFRPDDYIQKPFDIRELLTRVRKFVNFNSTNQRFVNKVA